MTTHLESSTKSIRSSVAIRTLSLKPIVNQVKFPIYKLPSEDVYLDDGVLFYGWKVIDDYNMPGDTMGIRRLQSGRDSGLFKLKLPIFNIYQLINVKGCDTFVDSNGMAFKYLRLQNGTISTYKIRSIVLKETLTYVKLYGIPSPFLLPAPPPEGSMFCTVLELDGMPWLPLGYYASTHDIPKKVRRRV